MSIFKFSLKKKKPTEQYTRDETPLLTQPQTQNLEAGPTANDAPSDAAADMPEVAGESVLLMDLDDQAKQENAQAQAQAQAQSQNTPTTGTGRNGFWGQVEGESQVVPVSTQTRSASSSGTSAASYALQREAVDIQPVAEEIRSTTPMSHAGDEADVGDSIIEPHKEAIADAMLMHSVRTDRVSEIIREIGERPKDLPIIGRMKPKTQYAVSIGLLAASLAAAGLLAGTGFLRSADYQAKAEVGTRLEMLSQRMVAKAQYAIGGDAEASRSLSEAKTQIALELENIVNGTDHYSGMSLDENENLLKASSVLKNDLLPMAEQMVGLSGALVALGENSKMLNTATQNLYQSADQLTTYLMSNGASDVYVSASNHIRVLGERLRRNGVSLLSSTDVNVEPMSEFATDLRGLQFVLNMLQKGSPDLGIAPLEEPQVAEIMAMLGSSTKDLIQVSAYINDNAPSIVRVRRSLQDMLSKSDEALSSAGAFAREMSEVSATSMNAVYISLIFVVMSMASIVLLGLVNNSITRREAWESAFKNKLNEKDIIDFMEACMPLEMGDLTVRFNQDLASMEGITGGIRNSVNEAVLSLNEAVDTVKKTAENISEVVDKSVHSTSQMKESNESQASEIEMAELRVAGLTSAIEQVAEKTVTAAEAALSARAASTQGAEVVSLTNQKMGVIRSNMQDVLKSVKHLGETSQEIGDIVVTIEQITDRTQVLAVNASLEAARAGSAGSGFQIIAGEVNRLAEQSAEALRSITALVQRVQGETGSTIGIVEESTNNVVEGAQLSDQANEQLLKISALAEQLTELMQDIREQNQSQSADAKQVKETMERLADLSRNFQTQVSSVVAGVERIDSSMGSLKNTVSIFKTESVEAIA